MPMYCRRAVAMLLAPLAAVILGAAGASTATAQVPPFLELRGVGAETCPAGWFCWYNDPFYNQNAENWMWRSQNSQPDLGRSPGSNDEAESVINNTTQNIALYQHWGYGLCVNVPPGGQIPDLDEYGLQNQATSIYRGHNTCPPQGYVSQ